MPSLRALDKDILTHAQPGVQIPTNVDLFLRDFHGDLKYVWFNITSLLLISENRGG